jgi:hypothetical protein
LRRLARSIVTPAPEVEVRAYEHDGKTLLVLTVSPGANPPYGITVPGRQNGPVLRALDEDGLADEETTLSVRKMRV